MRLRFLIIRDVGVGVFPEGQEILVGSSGFGCVALQHVGAGETNMRKCADRVIQDGAAMDEYFLELACALLP